MKVYSRKYPSVSFFRNGQKWTFNNFVCDLPLDVALEITSGNPDYYIDTKDLPNSSVIPFDPDSWTKGKKLIWDGSISCKNGFGKSSMNFIEALDRHCDIRVVHNNLIDDTKLSDNFKRIYDKKMGELDAFYIQYVPPAMFQKRIVERQIGFTMFECSLIPQNYVDACNAQERIIVPCLHNKQAFIDSGVKRQIQVIPLGIDLNDFPEQEETEADNLWYFGTMGTLTHRKGADVLIKAFQTGLQGTQYKDARLFLKTQKMQGSTWANSILGDPRISVNQDSFSASDLIKEFFNKIDCFVAPTRGEGFGLPIMEALIMSKPTIATNWSGPADFLDPSLSLPLQYSEVKIPRYKDGKSLFEVDVPEGTKWAEPNLDDLIDKMRWTYNNRSEAKEMGKRAGKYYRKEYDINNISKKLVNYLNSKF